MRSLRVSVCTSSAIVHGRMIVMPTKIPTTSLRHLHSCVVRVASAQAVYQRVGAVAGDDFRHVVGAQTLACGKNESMIGHGRIC